MVSRNSLLHLAIILSSIYLMACNLNPDPNASVFKDEILSAAMAAQLSTTGAIFIERPFDCSSSWLVEQGQLKLAITNMLAIYTCQGNVISNRNLLSEGFDPNEVATLTVVDPNGIVIHNSTNNFGELKYSMRFLPDMPIGDYRIVMNQAKRKLVRSNLVNVHISERVRILVFKEDMSRKSERVRISVSKENMSRKVKVPVGTTIQVALVGFEANTPLYLYRKYGPDKCKGFPCVASIKKLPTPNLNHRNEALCYLNTYPGDLIGDYGLTTDPSRLDIPVRNTFSVY